MSDLLQQSDKVKMLQDTALALTGKIITKTIHGLDDGIISALEAAQVVRMVGLSVDKFSDPTQYHNNNSANDIKL